MTDNITLPREVAELIENLMHHAYNDGVKQLKYRSSQTVEAEEALRTALAAEQPVPTDKDSLTVRSRQRTRKKRLQDDGWKKTREICS